MLHCHSRRRCTSASASAADAQCRTKAGPTSAGSMAEWSGASMGSASALRRQVRAAHYDAVEFFYPSSPQAYPGPAPGLRPQNRPGISPERRVVLLDERHQQAVHLGVAGGREVQAVLQQAVLPPRNPLKRGPQVEAGQA